MGRDGTIRRRTFLQLGVGAAALSSTVRLGDVAGAQGIPGPFRHGVASGDPLPDGILLWTRVTPSDDAVPGSGRGASTAVAWEIGTDPEVRVPVATGTVTSTATTDHTIRVAVSGLTSDTTYWYRFRALGASSPVGRTRTAPAADSSPASLRIGVVSCSNWEGGWFSAYRHLADRDDLDLVLHLGDYVYEYGAGGYGPGSELGRTHDPAVEMTTLEHYRRRHAQYKTDPDLARLHQRYAVVATIDDHETADNSWRDGAVNHQPGEGDWAQRRSQALQAYFEWMPIRATGGAADPTRIHRHLRFGTLADLFVLDERTHRSPQVEGVQESLFVTSSEVAEPDRTLLGPQQAAWLRDGLRSSAATWKVLGNPVMFAPLVLADLPDAGEPGAALSGLLTGLGLAPPIVVNADQWDGYRAEQQAFTRHFAEAGGVVLLTGDIHSSWAAEIPADPGAYLPGVGGATAAVEFVTPAVTSDSFSAAIASIGVPGVEAVAPLLPSIVTTAGPWFKYLDGDRHGFGVFEVTPAAAQFDWFYVSDRTDRHATLVTGPSFRSPVGSNKLEAATALGPRPRPTTPEAGPTPAPTSAPTPAADADGHRLPATGGAAPTAAAALAAAAGLGLAAAARRGQDHRA
jgi:alkaline phosphatase D